MKYIGFVARLSSNIEKYFKTNYNAVVALNDIFNIELLIINPAESDSKMYNNEITLESVAESIYNSIICLDFKSYRNKLLTNDQIKKTEVANELAQEINKIVKPYTCAEFVTGDIIKSSIMSNYHNPSPWEVAFITNCKPTSFKSTTYSTENDGGYRTPWISIKSEVIKFVVAHVNMTKIINMYSKTKLLIVPEIKESITLINLAYKDINEYPMIKDIILEGPLSLNMDTKRQIIFHITSKDSFINSSMDLEDDYDDLIYEITRYCKSLVANCVVNIYPDEESFMGYTKNFL